MNNFKQNNLNIMVIQHQPWNYTGGEDMFDWAIFLKIVIAVLQAILQNLPL